MVSRVGKGMYLVAGDAAVRRHGEPYITRSVAFWEWGYTIAWFDGGHVLALYKGYDRSYRAFWFGSMDLDVNDGRQT